MVKSKPLPIETALVIGDIFHNLSGALDYLSSAIIRQTSTKDERIYFPSTKDRSSLRQSFMHRDKKREQV